MPNKYLLILLLFAAHTASAQSDPKDRALAITSEFIAAETLQLSWPTADTANTVYSIFKRSPLTELEPVMLAQQTGNTFTDQLSIGVYAEYFVYASNPFPFRDSLLIQPGTYKVQVEDQFGKGLCCNFGNGYFCLLNEMADTLFFASDFGFGSSEELEIDTAQQLIVEVQSDLFGNHMKYLIKSVPNNDIITGIGSFGKYLQRPPSYGVLWIANEYRLPATMGSTFIAVADNLYDELSTELSDLEADLIQLGYQVTTTAIDITLSDAEVKDIIDPVLSAGPAPHTLFLLGNIPVPYSGDMFPDTHSENHKGAWAADGFYGVANDLWSDSVVTETSAFFDRNKNVPNDGKWDQSTFPGTVNYRIGRVDMSELSAFEKDELELTRDYLNKARKWRRGEIPRSSTAIIDDNFDTQFGAPAANGYRNLWNLLGEAAVQEDDFSTSLTAAPSLWVYSCGSGSHSSSEGVSSTAEIAEDSLQAIFLMSFGSQFGDWDNPNNFLRAPLASGTVLTNSWVGNPHQDFREMGVGWPIGMAMHRNMNRPSPLHQKAPVMVHLGLMGDPTLTQYPIAPPQDLTAVQINTEVKLSWSAPALNAENPRYKVYHRSDASQPYTLLTTEAIQDTTFVDSAPLNGQNDYAVVTESRIVNNAGSFYKSSIKTELEFEYIFVDAVEDFAAQQDWIVYPNPTNGQIRIMYDGLTDNSTEAQVIDILGKVQTVSIEEKNNTAVLELQHLPAGVYYYKKGELLSPPLLLFR